MKALFFISFSLFLLLNSCSQTNEDFLLGKWVVYYTTDQTDDSFETDKPSRLSNRKDTLHFKENNVLDVYWLQGEPPMISDYEFQNDSLLRLGESYYIFRKIDDDRIILDDFDPTIPNFKFFLFRQFFIRIE